jgi:hypothetical protein
MNHGNIHYDKLAERVGRLHLQQRLSIEHGHAKQISDGIETPPTSKTGTLCLP